MCWYVIIYDHMYCLDDLSEHVYLTFAHAYILGFCLSCVLVWPHYMPTCNRAFPVFLICPPEFVLYLFSVTLYAVVAGALPIQTPAGWWKESVPDWVVRTPDWSCLPDCIQGFARLLGPVRNMPNHEYIKKTILPDWSNFPTARLCVVVRTPDCKAPDCCPILSSCKSQVLIV